MKEITLSIRKLFQGFERGKTARYYGDSWVYNLCKNSAMKNTFYCKGVVSGWKKVDRLLSKPRFTFPKIFKY